jgi:hypothetical protein
MSILLPNKKEKKENVEMTKIFSYETINVLVKDIEYRQCLKIDKIHIDKD